MMPAAYKLKQLLSHSASEIGTISSAYRIIKAASKPEQPNLLQLLFIEKKYGKSDKSLIPETELEPSQLSRHLFSKYPEIIDAYVDSLISGNPTEMDFYTKLWEFITCAKAFPDDLTRISMLYHLATGNKCIPYFQIDLTVCLQMDNAQYEDYIRNNIGAYRLACLHYKLASIKKLKQKTMLASSILQDLAELSDYKEKCVFMSCVIAYYMRETIILKNKVSQLELVIAEEEEEKDE